MWSPTQSPGSSNCWGSSSWGNGSALADLKYTYDYIGKVLNRSGTGGSENVCYDALNRLTGYNAPDAACSGAGTISVVYDDAGNIIEKSDVCAQLGCYSYPEPGNVRPHAIRELGATYNGVSEPTFTYDNNGNLTSGAGRSISYTGFNMVSQMTDGTTNLCWTYNADHQRVRMDQVSTCGGSAVSSTYYLNDPVSGAMAEKVVSGSNTTWKDYLIVSGVMIGTRTVVNGGAASETYYVLDRMGSVAVTTDQTGALVCRIAYDAWGNRSASGSSCVEPTREFTGEETINTGALVNLVNLNARVYDPILGRFMSADPVTGSPYNGQNLNAYTYALNSPLLYTDSTGEQTVCYQLGGSNGSGGYNGNLGTTCFDNGSYSGPGSGFSPDTSIFSGSFGGAINDEDGPSSTTTDWGCGGCPPTVRGQAGSGSLSGTPNNAVPSVLGHPLTYDGTLLKFAINPLATSAAAQHAIALPEAGLGNGGENIIFQAVLAAVTLGESLVVESVEKIGLTAAEQLTANRAAGAAFGSATGAQLQKSGLEIAPQITIRTESGFTTRLDFLTRDPLTGKVGCIECKASQTAPLTIPQTLAFPEIEQTGGTILGAGKPGFPGGMQIPPTGVTIIRGGP